MELIATIFTFAFKFWIFVCVLVLIALGLYCFACYKADVRSLSERDTD